MWDHLFIMCKNQLDIESPYPKPTTEDQKIIKTKINNTQGSVKHKHYGKLIIMLIQEALKLDDDEAKTQALYQIAKQMKRSYLNWNQTNVQDAQIWNDLEQFANSTIDLDKTKLIPVFQTHNNRRKIFYKKNNKKHYSKK